jgi:hypothetical protein
VPEHREVSVTAGMHNLLEQQVLHVEYKCYKVFIIINGVNLCRQHMSEADLKTNYSTVDTVVKQSGSPTLGPMLPRFLKRWAEKPQMFNLWAELRSVSWRQNMGGLCCWSKAYRSET